MQALKEWSSVVGALESGDQLVVLRKGGILDVPSGFRFSTGTFALFPTHEHQDDASIKAEHRKYLDEGSEHGEGYNTVGSCATVLAQADVTSNRALEALSPMHIWSDEYMAQRVAWKPERPIRAALLQVSKSVRAKVLTGPEHSGCKSWIDIKYEPTDPECVINEDTIKKAADTFREAVAA